MSFWREILIVLKSRVFCLGDLDGFKITDLFILERKSSSFVAAHIRTHSFHAKDTRERVELHIYTILSLVLKSSSFCCCSHTHSFHAKNTRERVKLYIIHINHIVTLSRILLFCCYSHKHSFHAKATHEWVELLIFSLVLKSISVIKVDKIKIY